MYQVDRNRQIVEMRKAGYTFGEIGIKFGISRERVRQIFLGYQRRTNFKQIRGLNNPYFDMYDSLDKRVLTVLLRMMGKHSYYSAENIYDAISKITNVNDIDFWKQRGVGKKTLERFREIRDKVKLIQQEARDGSD